MQREKDRVSEAIHGKARRVITKNRARKGWVVSSSRLWIFRLDFFSCVTPLQCHSFDAHEYKGCFSSFDHNIPQSGLNITPNDGDTSHFPHQANDVWLILMTLTPFTLYFCCTLLLLVFAALTPPTLIGVSPVVI